MTSIVEEHAAGLSWHVDEPMQRASHALGDADGVWLVDALEDDEALTRATAIGPVKGVIQLLDRHARDNAALAERFGVQLWQMPIALTSSPFLFVDVVNLPMWRESALWWPERKALVVSETLGTAPYFRLGPGAIGVHPFMRPVTPSAPRRLGAEIFLCGHGAPYLGPDTAGEIERAYKTSISDLRFVPPRLPSMLRAGADFRP